MGFHGSSCRGTAGTTGHIRRCLPSESSSGHCSKDGNSLGWEINAIKYVDYLCHFRRRECREEEDPGLGHKNPQLPSPSAPCNLVTLEAVSSPRVTVLCHTSLWAHRVTALLEHSPKPAFHKFLRFITHGPGWAKCAFPGFLGHQCLPLPRLSPPQSYLPAPWSPPSGLEPRAVQCFSKPAA